MDPVRPKKKFGQHFLKDEYIARKIVEALDVSKGGKVLEVGAGTGVLTKYLIEMEGIDFVANDIDEESIGYLKKKYQSHHEKFILQDFLSINPVGDQLSVIGNFPYNVSSQIFFKIYHHRSQVDQVVGMVQKEVADRIAASHGSKTYGILSVLLQAFYNISYLFTVDSSAFTPPPKVQSGVIRLERNHVDQLGCDEKLFKKVVKEGFQKRRKTLWNALKNLNLPDHIKHEEVFGKRAEQLPVSEFVNLTNLIDESWKK